MCERMYFVRNTHIEYFSDKNVFHTVHKLRRMGNELGYDFKLLPSDVNSQLFSSYCLDAYGSKLWNFDSKIV